MDSTNPQQFLDALEQELAGTGLDSDEGDLLFLSDPSSSSLHRPQHDWTAHLPHAHEKHDAYIPPDMLDALDHPVTMDSTQAYTEYRQAMRATFRPNPTNVEGADTPLPQMTFSPRDPEPAVTHLVILTIPPDLEVPHD